MSKGGGEGGGKRGGGSEFYIGQSYTEKSGRIKTIIRAEHHNNINRLVGIQLLYELYQT